MIATGYKNGLPTGLQIDKPSITQRDADDYRTSIDYLLLEDNTQIEPSALPEAAPVTDVEKLQQGIRTYREANEAAKETIFTLMVKVAGALMAFDLFTEDNVNAEGARFVAFHREPILDYKTAGRNAVSAQALYASVASDASKAAFPWLEGGTGPTFLGLFASELGVKA